MGVFLLKSPIEFVDVLIDTRCRYVARALWRSGEREILKIMNRGFRASTRALTRIPRLIPAGVCFTSYAEVRSEERSGSEKAFEFF